MSGDKPKPNLVSIKSGQASRQVRDELRSNFTRISELIEPGIKGYAMVVILSNDEVLMCDRASHCYFSLIGGVEAVKLQILEQMSEGKEEE